MNLKRVHVLAGVVFLWALPLVAQTPLPPAPATVAEAVKSCNDLAYAYAKNTVAYWENTTPAYATDRIYFYKRMCGWQSEGGPDQAVFGLWAVPPSPWHVATADPVIPIPPPTAHELDRQIEQVLELIETLKLRIAAVEALPSPMPEIDAVAANLAALTARVAVIEGRVIPTQCRVSLFGITGSCKLLVP